MEAWKKEKKLKTLGLPTFYAMKGQQEHNGNSYRFIIISKFGSDLQKLLDEHKEFSLKNTLTIGSSLVRPQDIKISQIIRKSHSEQTDV